MGAGFQFVHFGAFSRKGNKQGQSTNFVFGEAERRPDASLHVSNPSSPGIVFGLAVSEVRALHDERATAAKDVMKNGRSRAIRSTQQTLATVIASHPYEVAEARADQLKAAEVQEWERLTVEWLQKQFGPQLVSVIRHTDERHCHLHCYILPQNGMMKAVAIHPGHVAKAAVIAAGPQLGEDEKTLNKRGDKAYRAAMREWQDDYYHHVGAPCGLTRIGPQVRRLKRAEWQAEIQAAQALKNSLANAAAVDAKRREFVKRTKQDAGKFVEQTRKQASETIDRAKEKALAIEAEAARRIEEAKQATAAALAARDRAADQQEQARKAMAVASRYGGWAGRLRAIWDSLRKSTIAERIRAEFIGELDRAEQKMKQARRRIEVEHEHRREAEQAARESRQLAATASFERDQARSILSRYQPSEPEPEVTRDFRAGPRLELRPKFTQKPRA